MEIKQINRTNFDVRFSNRHQDFLFISDVHYDSVKCDRAKLKKHFYGTVSLKPDKAILDFDQIVREVVEHFSSKVDAKVKINIEIDAQSPNGFDEATQRTVKENSRTLGFKQSEFEEE